MVGLEWVWKRSRWVWASLISGVLASWASAATAALPTRPSASEITPEVERAVTKGMMWLALQQKPDGSFGSGSNYGRNTAITALACMAYMCDGQMPDRGRYGSAVRKGLEFILRSSSESGLLAAETSHGPMYEHGFSTLFLAEVYGMTHLSGLDEKLRRAVHLIVRTQNDQGGWRYQPVRSDADISVTICQVMALRSARNAGIAVPKSTIDRAVDYVRRSQNSDGGFRYMLTPGESAFARSAAGVAALYYCGIYQDPVIDRGLAYLQRFRPGPSTSYRVPHYYYGQYYAIQAMFVAGGEHWERWWPAIRDSLLSQQDADGAWQGEAGNEYGTAMALIILQVPKRLLPIFER